MTRLAMLLCCVLVAAPLLAQEPAHEPSPSPRTGTGDGGKPGTAGDAGLGGAGDALVTLPLSEFEALLGAGGGARRGPPASWALREATYVCEVVDDGIAAGDLVRVTAALKLDVLADGYQAVPIGGGVVFEKAKLDGADVLLVATDNAERSAVLVPARGTHTLEVAFVVPAPPDPSGMRRLGFGIARSPLNRVVLSLAKEPAQVHAVGGVVTATTRQGARTEVQMAWPASDQVTVVWAEPQPAPATSASAAPPPPRIEGQLLSRYAFKLDRLDIDAQAVISVRQGSLAEVAVQVPPACRVLRIREQNGETTPAYTSAPNSAGTLITIKPPEPITGEKRYRLEVEQPYPEPVQLYSAAASASTSAAPIGAVPLPIGPTQAVASPANAAPSGPAPSPASPASPAVVAASATPAASTTTPASAAPPPSLRPSARQPLATPEGAGPVGPVGATGAVSADATSAAATAPTSGPPPPPPVTVRLAFLGLPGLDAVSGEFTLAYPATPLLLDQPPEPVEPVKRAVSLSSGIPSGPSFSYTGTPKYAVTLRAVRTMAQSPVSVPELRARTIVLSEGGFVTRASWAVVNRREATLAVSLPPGAEVLTAFVDGEPVRLGLRNAPPSSGREVRLPGNLTGAEGAPGAASASTTGPLTIALPPNAAPPTERTTAPWVDLVVPLRQDPDRPANVELTYKQPGPVLGSRDHLPLQLPRTQGDVTTVRWDLDVPAGWLARATATGLRVGEPYELKGQAATSATTGPRGLEASRAAGSAPRFDLPDPASGTRIPLAADSLKAGAAAEVELWTISLWLQQIARTVVFLLTLLALADLFWIGFGTTFTIGAGVALAGTVLACLLLGLSVWSQVVAGVVAALTFKLMRLLLDPVEEKETP